ncbi:MAG: fibronectin type III domain-containing protein [Lachnospiraceae bacterium]|nr:fibronectin type III domain-containing protein [Lachnospiraceae bacterium]
MQNKTLHKIMIACIMCISFFCFFKVDAYAWINDTTYTVYTGGYFEGTNNQSGAINMYVATITLETETTRVRFTHRDNKGKTHTIYYAGSKEVAKSGDIVNRRFLYTVDPDGESLRLDDVSGAVSIGWPNYDGMEADYEKGTPGANPNEDGPKDTEEDRSAAALLEQLKLDGLFSGAGMILYTAKTVNSITGDDPDTMGAVSYLNDLFNNSYEVGEQKLPILLNHEPKDDGTIVFRIIFPNENSSGSDKSALEKFFVNDKAWTDYKNICDYLTKRMAEAKKAKKELQDFSDGKKNPLKMAVDEQLEADFSLTVGNSSVIKGSQTLSEFLKPKLSVAGYLEITTDTDFRILGGNGKVIGMAKSDNKPMIKQYIKHIGPLWVPYYWKMGFDYEGDIEVDYKLKYDHYYKRNSFDGDGSITGTGKVNAQVGLGLVGIANVNGNLDMNFQAGMYPRAYMKTDGKLYLGVKFLNYYKENLLEPYTFRKTLWDYQVKTEYMPDLSLAPSDFSGLRLTAYEGDVSSVFDGSGETDYSVEGNVSTSGVLLDKSMPDSNPTIVTLGSKEVMVYLTMKESGSPDAGRLMYSVKTNGRWSTPLPVWDNGKADYYSDMRVVNGKLYLTWQKAGSKVTGQEGEEQFLNAISGSEICFASFDETLDQFTGQTYITDNDHADIQPKLVENTWIPSVVWIENGTNSIDGKSAPNQIKYSKLDGTNWTTPENLSEVIGTVGNYVVVEDQDDLRMVYSVVDTAYSVNEESVPLTNLYRWDKVNGTVIEQDQSFISGLKYSNGKIYWLNGEGQFKSVSADSSWYMESYELADGESISPDFTVVSNDKKTAVISRVAVGEGFELRAALINDGVISKSYRLFEKYDSNLFSFDAAIDIDGRYDIVLDDELDSDTEHNRIAEVIKEVTDSLDVVSVYMSDINRDADNNQGLKVLLKNDGETTLSKFYLSVSLGKIKYVNDKQFNRTIKPGESIELSTDFSINKITQPTEFVVCVYAEGQNKEEAKHFNVTVGYTDVSVEANKQITEDKKRIRYKVTNNTDSLTSGTIKLYDDLSMTNLVAELPFDSLDKGESNYLYYNLNKDKLSYNDDGLVALQAVVETEVYDSKQSNNYAVTAVYKSEIDPDKENGQGQQGSDDVIDINPPSGGESGSDLPQEGTDTASNQKTNQTVQTDDKPIEAPTTSTDVLADPGTPTDITITPKDKSENKTSTTDPKPANNTKKITVPSVGKVTSFKALAGSKRLVLKWKKVKNISGYEIQLSTKSKFKSAKKLTVKSSKKTCTVKKLKAKKLYYVRIRAYKSYKTNNGKTAKSYGKWVKISKKTKK